MPNSFLSGLLSDVGFEPQRVNNARIIFPSPGIPANYNGKTVRNKDGGELIFNCASTIGLPKFANNAFELPRFNQSRHFAGRASPGTLSVQVVDYVSPNVARDVLAWKLAVYDPRTGQVGMKRDYAVNAYIWLLPPNGDLSLVRQYDIFGVWPSEVDPGDFDLEGDGQVKLQMTLVYDNAVPAFVKNK